MSRFVSQLCLVLCLLILVACANERKFNSSSNQDQDGDGVIAEYDCDDADKEKGSCALGDECIFDAQCGEGKKCAGFAIRVCVCEQADAAGEDCGECADSTFTGEN